MSLLDGSVVKIKECGNFSDDPAFGAIRQSLQNALECLSAAKNGRSVNEASPCQPRYDMENLINRLFDESFRNIREINHLLNTQTPQMTLQSLPSGMSSMGFGALTNSQSNPPSPQQLMDMSNLVRGMSSDQRQLTEKTCQDLEKFREAYGQNVNAYGGNTFGGFPHSGINLPIITSEANSSSLFKIILDMRGLKPDEMCVSVNGDILDVSTMRVLENPPSCFSQETTNRQYRLPSDIRIDLLQCKLSEDGVMAISAPRTNASLSLT